MLKARFYLYHIQSLTFVDEREGVGLSAGMQASRKCFLRIPLPLHKYGRFVAMCVLSRFGKHQAFATSFPMCGK